MSAAPQPNFVSLGLLLGIPDIALDEMFWQKACELRVAVPAVVTSVGNLAGVQTVTVQPAVQENQFQNLVPTPVSLPALPDVAVLVYGAGGFVITLPIAVGDECLVVFTDMCYNAWWVAGGTVNNQEERRRHDLSDGIAIFGLWSNPRAIANYTTNALEVRSLDGNTFIQMKSGQVVITPDNGTTQIAITPGNISLTATVIDINGTSYHAHIHSGVTTGAGVTGPITP